MSETQRLLALLAEARVWMLADSRSTRDYASKVFDLNQRIIAALDQSKPDPTLTVREACRRRMPIDGADAQALENALTITERERDEARAELSRWRGNFDGPLAFVRDHTDEAFRRGAEAMREAAATAVFDRHTTGLLSPAAVTTAVRVIRALPLPEREA